MGIDHSMLTTAIMTPNFEYNEAFRRNLNSDDIQAIQAIYGPKRETGDEPDENVRNRWQICTSLAAQFNLLSPSQRRFCRIQKEILTTLQ